MPSTTNLALPYPSLTSAPNVPQDIQNLAQAVDTKLGMVVNNFTPVLTAATTNPTLGSGSSAVGRYLLLGKTCFYRGEIVFGTSGAAAGSGQYFVSLPFQAAAITSLLTIGTAQFRDNSSGSIMAGSCYLAASATTLSMVSTSINGSGTPWAWAASDYMAWSITYETV